MRGPCFFLFQSIFACVHWIRQVSTNHSCRQLCFGIDVAAVPRRESPRRVGVPQHHGHVDTRKKTPTKCHADCQEMQYMRQLSQHTQNNADRHSVKFVWYLICSPLVRSYAYGHPPPPSIRQWSCVSSAFQWQSQEAMARKSHARTAQGWRGGSKCYTNKTNKPMVNVMEVHLV